MQSDFSLLPSWLNLAAEGMLIQRPEPFFLDIDPAAPPHDPQASHHGNRQVHAQHASHLAARHDAENRRQRVQLMLLPITRGEIT